MMDDVVIDEILEAFMTQFVGYGNLAAPLWFIGMEEGGGNTKTEIRERLNSWHQRGRREVEDLAEFHEHFGISDLFTPNTAPIQRTWSKLIRTALVSQGQHVNKETLQAFQVTRLGRSNGDTCLLELFPLPSPSINNWIYGEFSKIPMLASRKMYHSQIGDFRINRLSEMIIEHKPKAVVFYGKTYDEYWLKICKKNGPWVSNEIGKTLKVNGTTFFIVPHPTSYGVTNNAFDILGKHIQILNEMA